MRIRLNFGTFLNLLLQPQVVVFLANPDGEPSTFPRYYFNTHMWYQLVLKLRQLSMLDANPQCASDCNNCDLSRCYLRRWLRMRILKPYNCTLFYERHNAWKGTPVCDPELIVRDYANVTDTSMYGTKVRT